MRKDKPGTSITRAAAPVTVGPFEADLVNVTKRIMTGRLVGKPVDPMENCAQLRPLARALDRLGQMAVNQENDRRRRIESARQAAAEQIERDRERAREREARERGRGGGRPRRRTQAAEAKGGTGDDAERT